MADLSKLPQAPAKCVPTGVTDQHGKDVFELRFGTATKDATKTGTVHHTTNGDEALYPDKSGTYSKGLVQKSYGVVDPTAFTAFRTALGSADGTVTGTADFEVPNLLGGKRKLNGPLGAFAFTLVGADSQAFGDAVVPPAPVLASPEYATELIELYWASLLRDVPFTDYETNAIAVAAAEELTARGATYAGPTDAGQGHPSPPLPGRADDTRQAPEDVFCRRGVRPVRFPVLHPGDESRRRAVRSEDADSCGGRRLPHGPRLLARGPERRRPRRRPSPPPPGAS